MACGLYLKYICYMYNTHTHTHFLKGSKPDLAQRPGFADAQTKLSQENKTWEKLRVTIG